LSQLQLKVAGTQRTEIYSCAEMEEGFSKAGVSVPLRRERTDSVSRGLSISFLT